MVGYLVGPLLHPEGTVGEGSARVPPAVSPPALLSLLEPRPTGSFQPLAHLIEGGAIDLATCIALTQNLQRIWLKRFVKSRRDRSVSASPAEPAARSPTEEHHDPYPKQGQQGPESKSPVHVNPLFVTFIH